MADRWWLIVAFIAGLLYLLVMLRLRAVIKADAAMTAAKKKTWGKPCFVLSAAALLITIERGMLLIIRLAANLLM